MIHKRSDLHQYMKVEGYNSFGGNRLRHRLLPPPSFQYVKLLRLCEYHTNSCGLWHKILGLWYNYRLYRIGLKSGISIPKNVCEKGLTLYHFGSIVVNAACHIGENCCIMNNVNIGANQGESIAPQIGKDVYIGPGAVIFGNIQIADGCYIGANAVVNKNITEPNSVVVGIPAKCIKFDTVHWWQKNGLNR